MRQYFDLTRSHTYSLLFVLPLLVAYEGGAMYLAQSGGLALRNGADVLLRTLLAVVGVEGTAMLAVGIALASAIIVYRENSKRKQPLKPAVFGGMILESLLYALMLGGVVGGAAQRLLDIITLTVQGTGLASLSTQEGLILSLGAGLYEELLFRVFLVGGLFALFRGGGATRLQAGGFAVVVAAFVFSAFHYVGPFGDPWALPSFLFRFLAGLAFSLLFLIRGFGITAWTHALYDVLIVLAVAR